MNSTTIIGVVTYEEQKIMLRAQLQTEYTRDNNLDSRLIDLVTEKIMAAGFNKEFYRGAGRTTTSFSRSPLTLDFKTKCKALSKVFGIILFTLFQIAITRKKAGSALPLGIIYAIPSRHYANRQNRDKLKHFLDSTLFKFGIQPPSRYLLQSGTLGRVNKEGNIEVVTHIGSKVLSSWGPSKTRTCNTVIARTVAWLKISRLHPSFFLIGSEYIVDVPAAEILKKQQKEFVLITTQSQLLAPPLLFKSGLQASRIMFWYSDNSVQISTQSSIPRDYSYLYQCNIDIHFVWTNSWARILSKFNQSPLIIPIGPVLFEPLEIKKVFSQLTKIPPKNILIFDVTPKKNADASSFYSERMMISFISDIVETVLEVFPNCAIRLKPKRKYSKVDSVGYRNYLASNSHLIQQLQPSTEVQSEILNSDLVICVPFTSPGLVAASLGIPTFYYSASKDFDLNHESLKIIFGKDSLKKFLLQEFSK